MKGWIDFEPGGPTEIFGKSDRAETSVKLFSSLCHSLASEADVYPFRSRRDFLIACSRLSTLSIFPAYAIALHNPQHDDKKDSAKTAATDNDPVYLPGKDVKPPKLIHYVEPQFSPSSKEAFVEGTVKISAVVTQDGIPTDLKIVSGLNSKEDETAVEALKQWRFQPGTKSGQPVRVRVTVEVDFHLL